MSTDLVVPAPAGALSELEQLIQDETANDGRSYTYQPPRYRVVSQSRQFQNVNDEDDLLREMTGIILISRITRAYWPLGNGNGDAQGGPPVCSSTGGVNGTWRNPDGAPRVIACASCPYNAWGSEVKQAGVRGRGKACKEMRRFAVLLDGYAAPVLLTIPPTSCKPFDQYASALANRKLAYFAVRTKIALEKAANADGIAYAVATFQSMGTLGHDELAWVVGLRRAAEEYIGAAPEYEEYMPLNGDGSPKDVNDPESW